MLQESSYDDTVDNWSLGVLSYELVGGRTPFFVDTSAWEEDTEGFKKRLHDEIFAGVKGWREEDAQRLLFEEGEKGRMFTEPYMAVVMGLMRETGRERMTMDEVVEVLQEGEGELV